MHLTPSGLGCFTFEGGGSVVVDSLFITAPIVCGSSVLVIVCYAVLSVLSSFDINLMGKRELVALI